METVTRERVRAWLERRFFLRIHMTLILSATFFAGLAATNALFFAGVHLLPLRYGLAVLAAYCVFLFLFRLWLMYVRLGGLNFDAQGVDQFFSGSFSGADVRSSGGGRFGGGGASGSWGTPAKAGSSSGGKSWFNFDVDGDELVIVLLFIALIAALLFAGIYIIYTAPAIFTEALFEAALAGALVNQAKKVDTPNWVGAVWRATVWPFLGILVLSVLLGWAVHRVCPSAIRVRDAFHCIEARDTPSPAPSS